MKKILILLCLLFTPPAFAIVVNPDVSPLTTISCNLPIAREDGEYLAPEEIAAVKFYSGIETGMYTTVEQSIACELVVDVTAKSNGNYFYVVTATDVDGRESQFSEELLLTVKRIRPPKAPTWR